jgi:hypothetical protein
MVKMAQTARSVAVDPIWKAAVAQVSQNDNDRSIKTSIHEDSIDTFAREKSVAQSETQEAKGRRRIQYLEYKRRDQRSSRRSEGLKHVL